MKFQSVREAAKGYRERGFRVVPLYGVDPDGVCRCLHGAHGKPCKDRDWGKHEPPETDGLWKDGRTFEPEDFLEGQNIGLAMGPWRNGRWLVALDVDGADDGTPFFPALPRTLTQKTPRGVHLVFTVPERAPLGNWVDVFKTKRAGFSLDLRYARGRIVVAPSRGAFGAYEWLYWQPPEPLPEYVTAAILSQRVDQGLSVQGEWDRGGKAP